MNGSATIAGQTSPIYTGLLSDTSTGYFTTFTITNVGTVPDPAPPVNVCDLVINFITVDKPESAPGAADGQITINATSSYGPILYSNDFGATYQTSPTFTGLTGGLAQPVVKDSNPTGCARPKHSNYTGTDQPAGIRSFGNVNRAAMYPAGMPLLTPLFSLISVKILRSPLYNWIQQRVMLNS